MLNKVMQFRYYGEEHTRNYPSTINKQDLSNGTTFKAYMPITQLGIQSLPGVRFYLNDIKENPIVIGNSGVYELGLDQTEIYNLCFESSMLETINANEDAYLIVDILYKEG